MDSQFYTQTFPKYEPVLIELVPPPLPVAQGVAGYPSDAGPIRIGLDGCVWRWVPGHGQECLAPGGEPADKWLCEHASPKSPARNAMRGPESVTFARIYEYRAGSSSAKRPGSGQEVGK